MEYVHSECLFVFLSLTVPLPIHFDNMEKGNLDIFLKNIYICDLRKEKIHMSLEWQKKL